MFFDMDSDQHQNKMCSKHCKQYYFTWRYLHHSLPGIQLVNLPHPGAELQ